jgi:hypothetical protein
MRERRVVLRRFAVGRRSLRWKAARLAAAWQDIMERHSLLVAACLALLMPGLPSYAAQAASAPASAASAGPSAPRTAKPVKRPLTAQELRDSASFPGDMRPEDMPPPQVTVPLGRKPPPPSPAETEAAAQGAAAPGKIDDRIARCKGLADARQRDACTRAAAASEPAGR